MTDQDESEDGDVKPIGQLLDALGIEATVSDGELVAGAIVLLKVVEPGGDIRLSMSFSDGLGWIERAGMIRIAERIESGPGSRQQAADDD